MIKSGVRRGSDEGPFLFEIYFSYVLLVLEKEMLKRPKLRDAGIIKFKDQIANECSNTEDQTATLQRMITRILFHLLDADDLVVCEPSKHCQLEDWSREDQ